MNVIVVGVGFMGAGLVARLSRQGFDVTAVDRDQKALDALDPSCTGKRICGVGFDRAVLEEAGIDRARVADAGVCTACSLSLIHI